MTHCKVYKLSHSSSSLRFRFVLQFLLLIILTPVAGYCDVSGSSLVQGAREQIGITVGYDPTYRSLSYPGGDVPSSTGVCTDVIIRAYRKVGVDLQKLVHEDMKASFSAYPSKRIWGLTTTDKNIDHRRVPNLQVFFSRKGRSLPVSRALSEALPGDIFTWDLPSGVPHIGIVSNKRSSDGSRPLVIHNIGSGAQEEDAAAEFRITGWYRYLLN